MLTDFGKALRRIRLEHDELLKDMADSLGVTSAYLSAVENGKKKASQAMLLHIKEVYDLTGDAADELDDSFHRSLSEVTVDTSYMTKNQKDLTLIFARKVASIDDDSAIELMKMLKK